MSILKTPALDPMTVAPPPGPGSTYPAEFQARVAGRSKRRIGNALGLSNFGVNLVTLEPGAASALRHWHTAQDEFIYVLSGEITLVTNIGAQVLTTGMCAGFPQGKDDGHHLVNNTSRPATYLEVGDRAQPDDVHYPDVDLVLKRDPTGRGSWLHKDGTPY